MSVVCYTAPQCCALSQLQHFCPSVRPSVCLSATRRYCVKTNEHRMMSSSLARSTTYLVYGDVTCKVHPYNQGVEWDKALSQRRLFDYKVAVASKPCDIRPRLLLTTNRKSHVPFRLGTFRWPWITLNPHKASCSQFLATHVFLWSRHLSEILSILFINWTSPWTAFLHARLSTSVYMLTQKQRAVFVIGSERYHLATSSGNWSATSGIWIL